jgi:serine/threonine protein kinase
MGINQRDQLINTVLDGRYRINDLVGVGGMGSVYEATHTVMDRSVAIKILHATDAAGIKRFEREARALSAIKSPAIPEFYGWGVTPAGCPYMVMEFIDFPPLSELIGESGTLAPETVKQIAIAACDALSAIHQAGLVHRDIKPANLMVQALSDGTVKVKVTDLGIARVAASMGGTTQTQSVVGSIAYMSPEHYTPAALEERSDLFSLGCVMYRCLAGHTPYEGETALSTALKMREGERDPLPDTVPVYLRNAIDRCLAVDPEQRFASAKELQDSLLKEIVEPLTVGSVRKRSLRSTVSPKWLALIAVLAMVPVTYVVLVGGQQKQTESGSENTLLYKQAMAIPFTEDPSSELVWIKDHYSDPQTVAAILRLRYQQNMENGRITRALTQHRQLGVYLRDQGWLGDSLKELQSALSEVEAAPELKKLSVAKTEMELGRTAFLMKDFDLAHLMLDKALVILEEEEPGGEARANAALTRAQVHENNGEPLKQACVDYETAMDIFHRRLFFDRELACLAGLVGVKERMHDKTGLSQLRQRLQQLKLRERYQLVMEKANLNDLLNTERLPPLADMIAAVEFYRGSNITQEGGSLSSLCIRIGQVYRAQGNPTECVKWFQESIKVAATSQSRFVRLANLNYCLTALVQLDKSQTPNLARHILEVFEASVLDPLNRDEFVPAQFCRNYSLTLIMLIEEKVSGSRAVAAKLAEFAKQRAESPPDDMEPPERLIYINCYLELKTALAEQASALPFLEERALPMVAEITPSGQTYSVDELSRFWQDAAAIYKATGQTDKNIESSIRGYNLNRAAQSPLAKAVTARHVGDTLIRANRMREAKPYFLESREVSRRMLSDAKTAADKAEALRLTDWSAYAVASYYLLENDLEKARAVCAEQEKLWKEVGESSQSFSVKKLIEEIEARKTAASSASEKQKTDH